MARRSGGRVLRSSPERTSPPEAIDRAGVEAVLFHRACCRSSVTASGSFHQSLPFCQLRMQVLARHLLERIPFAADVAGTARAVDQAERRPDGVVAAEDEAVAGAAQDGLHAAAVGFDAGGFGIVQLAAVHGAPEVGVELEIGHSPLLSHGAEDVFQVLLHLGVGAIERVPGAMAPSLESDLVGRERLAVFALHEPVGMLLEDVAAGFGDERTHPDGGLEALLANGLEDALARRRRRPCRSPANRPWRAGSRRRAGRI